MARMFGTDGVRGVAGSELSGELAYRLGQAGAHVLASNVHAPRILIGRDTRLSCDMLESALVAGICSVGAEAVLVGVLPTPAIAYLTRQYKADAGVVISASHNSMEHNGIKFFDGSGFKLPDALEDEIEALVQNACKDIPPATHARMGRVVRQRRAERDYIEFLLGTTKERLDGYKMVIDCANGAASGIAGEVFSRLGAQLYVCCDEPDGLNINDNCGSTHPERLQALVREQGADIGIAFDGDADRLIAVDEHGNLVDGDKIMAVCALDLQKSGHLKKNALVATVMSNLGLELAMKANGIDLVRTAVGDRYVLEHMLKEDMVLGGEQSGHIIFREFNTTGDGLLSAIQFMSVMARRKEAVSAMARVVKTMPQVLVNVAVSNEKKEVWKTDSDICEKIQTMEAELHGKGRVLIRPSGTEPLIRIMMEGLDQRRIENLAGELRDIMLKKLG